MTLSELTHHCHSRLQAIFLAYTRDISPPQLKQALEYTLLNGGKRIRPLLVYATAQALATPLEKVDAAAAAIEIIHTYSLIHDDLPCMDNADLRRGKPSCHRAFGEGMAVLTGDGLQALAFHILTTHSHTLENNQRLQMVTILSKACGIQGMVAGQAMDITASTPLSASALEQMYALKTGALLSASIELGIISSKHTTSQARALQTFGNHLGLAFQIQDDILDIESSSQLSGKPQGIDTKNAKHTYPQLHGIEVAKETVRRLIDNALQAISGLDKQADLLRELARKLSRCHPAA